MRYTLIIAAWLLMAAGPLSKFNDHKVLAEFDSPSKLEDIERCFLDIGGMGGLPQALRQPDRPDDVVMVWPARGPLTDTLAFRIDLHRTATGTHVRSWADREFVEKCAKA